MDPELTPDQQLLRETTARFIEANLPLSRVRDLVNSGGEPEAAYWLRGAELGWFAFLAPEELGGGTVSGHGLLDAVVLSEVRGSLLQPGPFTDTNVVVATLAIAGTEEQQAKVLPSLISGESSAAWALADPSGDWSGWRGVECEEAGDGFRLSGRKVLVVEAQSADWFLISTETSAGPSQFLVAAGTPGLSVEVMDGLDLTRRLCEVHFDALRIEASALIGEPGAAGPVIDRQLQLAGVLSMAECIGAMDHLFELTVQYCKDRIAFGRPIGSFQAIKHQLADTSLALEMAKAAATAAAHAVQRQAANSAELASLAKSFVGDAAVDLAHGCWQNLGGISYTWEHDFHLYLRRLTADASLYGPPAWHRERICQLEGI